MLLVLSLDGVNCSTVCRSRTRNSESDLEQNSAVHPQSSHTRSPRADADNPRRTAERTSATLPFCRVLRRRRRKPPAEGTTERPSAWELGRSDNISVAEGSTVRTFGHPRFWRDRTLLFVGLGIRYIDICGYVIWVCTERQASQRNDKSPTEPRQRSRIRFSLT